MPLQKQSVKINFQEGLDTKTDPFQIAIGKFSSLINSVFDTLKRLTKRNGFPQIQSLPDATSTYLTTYGGNLLAVGNDLKALSDGPQVWNKVASFTPLSFSANSLVRNTNNQNYVDTAISTNGLVACAYQEQVSSGGGLITNHKLAVYDYTTGQSFVPPQAITPTFGTTKFAPKVFNLSPHFVVVFDGTSGSTSHLQYIPISQNTGTVGAATDITTSFNPQARGSFDGVVCNSCLYVSWNASADAGMKSTYLDRFFNQSNIVDIASSTQVHSVSVCADNSIGSPKIWTSFTIGSSSYPSLLRTVSTDLNLNTQFSSRFVTTDLFLNLSSYAINNQLTLFYEQYAYYIYDSNIESHNVFFTQINSSGSASSAQYLTRSVGLSSKAFLIGSVGYVLTAYQSTNQPTYFLVNCSSSIVAKLAYSNGGGYSPYGVTNVSIASTTAFFGYLNKDLVTSVNKSTGVGSTTQTAQIYSQTGVNLALTKFGTSNIVTSEMAGALNINGGTLSMYDGNSLVENNFYVYPDDVEVVTVGSGGSVGAGTYFYQVTYEWTDNKGSTHRSAPSVPVSVVVGSASSTNSVFFPTLRITNKTNVKCCIYRWSTNQQIYYQVTSVTQPTLNDPYFDHVVYDDKLSDSSILGNSILYTTGNVVEDIGPPAMTAISQFDSRLWGIDAEDQNLLWYSKQVIESTPIEMSDLLTLFVQPNAGAQGSTGPLKCLFPMDDKLIIFKKNALYYISGTGPDNTGANSQYSEPIFIGGTVGSENQNSIVLTPQGLMFQSDKGIWILGRNLNTEYIGKDVEAFNSYRVLSSLAIPGTNQVRFTLSNGLTLMYDYFTGQWGIFKGITGISSTLYQNLHTYIDLYGRAFQEKSGTYLDGSVPTTMSYTTGWINVADLQGYARIYKIFLLGNFISPHTLTIGIAFDYDSTVVQQVTLNPTNYNQPWGGDPVYGSGPLWGGNSQVEQWQVNLQNQQCQSIQITFNEYYDPTKGAAAGAGLTLSGMNIQVGLEKSFPDNLGVGQKKG